MPWWSAASSRIVSSLWPHRYPVRAREWSSMNANRYVLRPATTGPCSASPVQRSLGAAASKRPNALGAAPLGRVPSSRRAKCRCRVRAEGAQPACSPRITATWAAVRAGTSRFSAAASSSTNAGVWGSPWRTEGTRASDPPVQGDPRYPDPVPERTHVVLFGELAHQRPALTGRQRRICYRADQAIPEQSDLLCPLRTAAGAADWFVAHSPTSTLKKNIKVEACRARRHPPRVSSCCPPAPTPHPRLSQI